MVRLGVLGVGFMGKNHARIYSEIADLVGVYDLQPDVRKEVAKRFNTSGFSNTEDLLSKVDAVSICTPTSSHFDLARKAIESGVSVLLEKPFTGSSEKARELSEMAERNGVTLGAGFVERFNPVVSAAKEALGKGSFGDPISITSRRVSSSPSRIRDVGVIMDLAIHDIDVIRYISSSEICSVYALGGHYSQKDFEDHANLLMRTNEGVVCFLEVNWLTPMKVRKVSLTCSGGFVELDYIEQSLEMCSSRYGDIDEADMFRIPLEHDIRRINVKKEEPLKRELESFLRAVDRGDTPESDGWEAYEDLRVCEAALKSFKNKEPIAIE